VIVVVEVDMVTMLFGMIFGVDMDLIVDVLEFEGLFCIEIYECELINGWIFYFYVVWFELIKFVLYFIFSLICDCEVKIGKIFDDVGKVWKNIDGDLKECERKL